MIVAIYAYENIFSGLHGICNHRVIEVSDMAMACDIAEDDSLELMDSYDGIMERFESDAIEYGYEEDTDEYYDYIEECRKDNIEYEIYIVKPYADIETMNYDFFNSTDNFIKEHCEEEV